MKRRPAVPGRSAAAAPGAGRVGPAASATTRHLPPAREWGARASTVENDDPEPDLVVLVGSGTADAVRADALISADVPHLAVVIGEDTVVVGPLVRPGGGACLHCLDLHRRDRDPAWPRVLTQLREQGERVAAPEEVASAGLAAGLATLQVLTHLDGQGVPAAVGATLEIELPDGLIARRPWPVHPACGNH